MSNSHKKICHITSVHPLYDTRIYHKECRSLVSAGYEVTLVVQHDTDEIIDGIHIMGISKPQNRRQRMLNTTRQVYRKALECNADLYHFHDPELIPVGLLLKRKGKKVIYDVHEDVPRQILSKHWIPSSLRITVSKFIEIFEEYSAKQFDYIITATPFIRDRFARIVCNTIDINNFPLLGELYDSSENTAPEKQGVAYVGGISIIRGILEMVDAAEKAECSLFLAGRFMSAKERNAVVRKPGWQNVKELGCINRSEVKELLESSNAGLVLLHPVPNYIEALPVKMFEYMSASIPVIASSFPLWCEIINSNDCGICVDPLDTEQIARAISTIIDSPEKAQKMGRNGRKAVEEKYNWETEARKMLVVYERTFMATRSNKYRSE